MNNVYVPCIGLYAQNISINGKYQYICTLLYNLMMPIGYLFLHCILVGYVFTNHCTIHMWIPTYLHKNIMDHLIDKFAN